MEDLLAGTPYRTVERIGCGGQAEVYLVEHRHLRHEFVAKILLPERQLDVGMQERFRREAQGLIRLDHPNLVRVYNFDRTESGALFLIMERLRGHTLHEELDMRGRIPPDEAVEYAMQALAGLAKVHAAHIVHRDVKPSNLFLCRDGGPPTVKAIDLGIAKWLSETRRLAVPTQRGTILATPAFAAPEQARGECVDARTDLYAMGVVLYRMLTGDCPFGTPETTRGYLLAHIRDLPRPPSSLCMDLPTGLEEVTLRALEKDPSDRFQSAAEFRAALDSVRQGRGYVRSVPTMGSIDTVPAVPPFDSPRSGPPSPRPRSNSMDPTERLAYDAPPTRTAQRPQAPAEERAPVALIFFATLLGVLGAAAASGWFARLG